MKIDEKRGLGILLSILMLTAGAEIAAAGPQEIIRESFDVAPNGTLRLESDIGSIAIRTHMSERVEVTVKREVRTMNRRRAEEILKDFHVAFDQKGDDVIIQGDFPNDPWQRFWRNITNSLRVKFEITVPEMYNCDLYTRGGKIEIEGIEGSVTARTSGGGLYFREIAGPINGRTSGGRIEIDSAAGPVVVKTSGGGIQARDIENDIKADTSGGRIVIARVRGIVDADTSGGSITIDEAEDAVRARTSGGSITATLISQPSGECNLRTSGGSITVNMTPEVSMDVDAHASGGRVSTEFPVTLRGEIKRNELKAQLNRGGPLLFLRTSGGGIRIKKR